MGSLGGNFDSFDVLIKGGGEELERIPGEFAKNGLSDRWEYVSIGTWGRVPVSWGGNFDTQGEVGRNWGGSSVNLQRIGCVTVSGELGRQF